MSVKLDNTLVKINALTLKDPSNVLALLATRKLEKNVLVIQMTRIKTIVYIYRNFMF